MYTSPAKSHCPLCKSPDVELFFEDPIRKYNRCGRCALVFVPPLYLLSQDDEKAIYDLHENHSDDLGYRKFLSRLALPLLEKIGSQKVGLDFGCGPGPTLSVMLEEENHRVYLYDPFYFPDQEIFNKKYDFITATEVVEHFFYPGLEFAMLFSLLKTDGWLAIMTKLVTEKIAFEKWHYIRDLSHVCFYSETTLDYLANQFQVDVFFIEKDVIFFKKK